VQAGAYFSEELNGQLVDALLEYGEKQLVGRGPVHLTFVVKGMHSTCRGWRSSNASRDIRHDSLQLSLAALYRHVCIMGVSSAAVLPPVLCFT
jgi:hypothetical protein